MNDVFVSYARQDAPWADALAAALSRAGLHVFLDTSRIKAGDDWEHKLAINVQDSRTMVVLWSPHAEKPGGWVSREIGTFEAVRYKPQSVQPDPQRRFIFVNLMGMNTAYQSVQQLNDLSDHYAGGFAGVPADVWRKLILAVRAGIEDKDTKTRIRVAVFAMTAAEVRALQPSSDAGVGRTFEDTVARLGLAAKGPDQLAKISTAYGADRQDWKPFNGAASARDLLDDALGLVDAGPPGYRWEFVDPLDFDPGAPSVSEFSAGPAVVLVDPLSLYHLPLGAKYRLLQRCVGNYHTLVTVLAPIPTPDPLAALSDITRRIAQPFIEDYFVPPIPQRPQALFAVNVADKDEARRLVRSCIGRHAAQYQASQPNPILGMR